MEGEDRGRGGGRGRLVVGVVVLGALIGGGYALWDGVVRDRVFPKRWAAVHEGRVYRSGQLSEGLVRRTWEDNGIKVVVNLGVDKPGRSDHEAAQDAARDLGIDREFFTLRGDGTGDVQMYIDALTRIREAETSGDPVVVHCAAGVNRTGGVVATYRMLFDGWSGEDAYAEMLSFGLESDSRLPAYLNENMGRIVEGLVARGVLAEAPADVPRVPEGE